MHRINLENDDIRLDLINDTTCKMTSNKTYNNISVDKIFLNKDESIKYKKREGEYISISFDDSTDSTIKENIINILTMELKKLIRKKKLYKKSVLVVGLGNNYSTPDSLGPRVIKNIISTRHLFLLNSLDKDYSVVSKITPGVFADTGIESFDIIKSLVDRTSPDYLIVIDSLSSKTLNKVNKVIQITDSGIDPGSGVGNQRKEISKNTIGIEVISIGVPTVVNLHTIVKDVLNDYDLDSVLINKPNNYMVTPKEIDYVIEQLSYIISSSINNSLHNKTK